jgi:RNA polymerase sigma-70 factor, ECF subfamily
MLEDSAQTNGRDVDRAVAIRRRFDSGCLAWPDIVVPLEVFEAYVARHATQEGLPAEAHASDMYLACACAHGIGPAAVQLERALGRDMARAVASIDSSPAFVEDVLQLTRVRLLVRKGDEPSKMADYAGRASLKSWLSAVAVRCAISQRRRKSDQWHQSLAPGDDLRLARGGPEFEYLSGRYKPAFEEALRSAIKRLPAKERMLLRLNLVDGMSIDRLGTMYRVGRSTAARWLAAARGALLEEVHRELRTKLRLTSTELESLGAEIRSQLDVSLSTLLAR